MKKILLLVGCIALLAGCASATPIDILIPTRKPSIATQEYLGHLYPTNNANGLYHSLVDTKVEKAMVPLRDAELKGLKIVAQGELEFFDRMGTATSVGVWGGISALLVAAGVMTPKPGTAANIAKAKAEPPD